MAGNFTSRISNTRASLGVAAVLAFLLCTGAHAQAAGTKGIEGQVRDGDGLPVPKATVTLRNALTGVHQRQETNAEGRYRFSDLAEGSYSLSVTVSGMSGEVRSVVIARGTEPQVVNVQLALRPTTQEITVVSGSRVEELQTDAPTRVEAVTREQMRDTGYERVSDVLAEIPGVLVRSGSVATVGA